LSFLFQITTALKKHIRGRKKQVEVTATPWVPVTLTRQPRMPPNTDPLFCPRMPPNTDPLFCLPYRNPALQLSVKF